jgi:hypothetical protein
MTLRVTNVRLSNPTRQEFLNTTLREIPTPPGEQWLARLTEDASTGVWELMVAGPAPSAERDGWEISRSPDDRLRFRTVLTNRVEQSADGVRRRVRRLVWNGVRFSVYTLADGDPGLAQRFEDAVWDVVLAANLRSLEVRLNFWSPAAGDLHCYCELEAAPTRGDLIPWHFWSPLARTPRELALVLTAALRERRGEPEHPMEGLLRPTAGEIAPWLWTDGKVHPLEGLLPTGVGYTGSPAHFV